jgi:glycosyltransferase involved in cell wall biosynthesis
LNKPLDQPALDGGTEAAPDIEISVVIPVLNESENVEPLLAEVLVVMRKVGRFEILFVDDGSTDGTDRILTAAKATAPELRVMRHANNCGQSAALRTGIEAARGAIIVTMDGDGQNDPSDIPALLEALKAGGPESRLAMVSGQRMGRKDSFTKRMASRIGNGVRSWLLGDGTLDTGCSLKAFWRDRWLRLPYFDHMHRFLPALLQREGDEIGFVPVKSRPRLHGRSKYGVFDRLAVSLGDLMGVMWLQRRLRQPGERREL